ncbi:MAG: hypothetical protein EOP45_12015 [Sphingobacteriaceae bacterium]|nr:MAG: hypothetical protein EOP45_12015 [Sphingobacteriaceae bacterium]
MYIQNTNEIVILQTCRGIYAELEAEMNRYHANRLFGTATLRLCEGARIYEENVFIMKEKSYRYGIAFEMYTNSQIYYTLNNRFMTKVLNSLETFSFDVHYSVNVRRDSYIAILKQISHELKQVKRIRIKSFHTFGSWSFESIAENARIRLIEDSLTIFINLPTLTQISMEAICHYTGENKILFELLDRLQIEHIVTTYANCGRCLITFVK